MSAIRLDGGRAGHARRFILSGVFTLCVLTADAGEVRRVVSALAGQRLEELPALEATSAAGAPADFTIDESTRHQVMDGFGASFLEAGMICLNSLPEERRDEVLRTLFDPVHGAGFNLMKTVLGGTDFMSAGPWFTYNDTPGDVAMTHFSIARDLEPNGLIPYIRMAREHGGFRLQATMDYPPDWMLIDAKEFQDVRPECFDALALYYLRYVREYEKQGIHIDFLSPFNEPSIYTKIPWWKIRALLADHLVPLWEKEQPRTKLMLPEAPNRRHAWENQPVAMDDPRVRRHIAVLPYHGYNEGGFAHIAALRARYPDVPVWMTELCHGYIVKTPREPALPRRDFEDGDHWGNMIFSDIEAGASAWIYWNMILDQNGGPWLVSPVHGNPDDNVQQPLVIVDREKKTATFTGAFWYLAHFSKFVRPGAVRVDATGKAAGTRCLAFLAGDGSRVVQLLHGGDTESQTTVACGDQYVKVSLPPRSITTCLWPRAE